MCVAWLWMFSAEMGCVITLAILGNYALVPRGKIAAYSIRSGMAFKFCVWCDLGKSIYQSM